MTTDKISRRTLGGIAAAGAGLPLLAACSSSDAGTATDSSGSPTHTPPSSASTGGSSGGGSADVLAKTSDIDVSGGEIFPDQQVVVTQPSAGQFKCFTAVCTHQGCIVSSVSDGDIHCACHGSAFSIADGSVVNGPATQPLAEQQITVKGGQVTLA